MDIKIYSNVSGNTKTVKLDMYYDVVVDENLLVSPTENIFYIKLSTTARDTDNLTYKDKLIYATNTLSLNSTKQSAVDSSNAYSSIDTMITDYLYDYINGHVADKFSSGVTAKSPMEI